MQVVSNSSPLIALAAINQLPLLHRLFDSVLIPSAVAHEIKRSVPDPLPWMREQKVSRPLPQIVLRPGLGSGEREAIALAIELRAEIIILDDLAARKAANSASINVIGTLGILLAAKRKGFIANVRLELDRLIRASFFLSPELYSRVLEASNERLR